MITFTTKNYFDGVIYLGGWVLLLLSIPAFIVLWYVGIIMLLVGIIIISTAYKIEIAPQEKFINEYLWFLGIKLQQEKYSFDNLAYFYITKSRYSQQLNMGPASSTARGVIYTGFLKSDAANHYLGESKKVNELSKKIDKLNKTLKLSVNLPENE